MGSIRDSAGIAFDDYNTTGVPSSGVKPVKKSEVKATFGVVEDEIALTDADVAALGVRMTTAEADIVALEALAGAAPSGFVGFTTQALLFAALNYAAGTVATVYSDPDTAKRGDYIKVGASGVGSWTGPMAISYGSSTFTTLNATTGTVATLGSTTANLTTGNITTANLTTANIADLIIKGAGTVGLSWRPNNTATDQYEIYQDNTLTVTERLNIGGTMTTIKRVRSDGEHQIMTDLTFGNDRFKAYHEGRLPPYTTKSMTANEEARNYYALVDQYPEDSDPVTINNGEKPYIASFDNKYHHISCRSTTGFVDVSFLNAGVPVVISCTETPSNAVCRIYAGTWGKFRGVTNKVIQIGSGSTVRIMCVDDVKTGANYDKEFSLQVVEGTVNTTTASQTLPIYSKTFAVAGQSLGKRCLDGSFMAGFQRRLQDLGLSRDVLPISGAVGSTGLAKGSSVAGYWWDQDTSSLSTLSTDLVARIQAAIAAGQPAPQVCFVNFGQADSNVASTAGTVNFSSYQTMHTQWASAMNAALGFSMIYMGWPLGSEDVLANVSSPTRTGDQRYTTLRAAMCKVCIDNPTLWVQGPEWYDTNAQFGVFRMWDDAHPTQRGQIILGQRTADQWANLVYSQTNDLGPRIISWTENTSTTFTARVQYTGALTRPEEFLIPEFVKLMPSGAPGPEVTPLPVIKMEYANAGTGLLDIKFTIASASSGARLVYPYGAAPGIRATLGFYGSAPDRKPLRSYFSN